MIFDVFFAVGFFWGKPSKDFILMYTAFKTTSIYQGCPLIFHLENENPHSPLNAKVWLRNLRAWLLNWPQSEKLDLEIKMEPF